MEKQRRIAFWFGSEIEVRYLSHAPRVGDYIGHGNELWLVSSVGEDAFGTSVTCERALEDRQHPISRSLRHVTR